MSMNIYGRFLIAALLLFCLVDQAQARDPRLICYNATRTTKFSLPANYGSAAIGTLYTTPRSNKRHRLCELQDQQLVRRAQLVFHEQCAANNNSAPILAGDFVHAIDGLDVQMEITRAVDYGHGDDQETGLLGKADWPDDDFDANYKYRFEYDYQMIFRKTGKTLAPGVHTVKVATLRASLASNPSVGGTQNIEVILTVPSMPTCKLLKKKLNVRLAPARTSDFAALPMGAELKQPKTFAIPLDCTVPPANITVTLTDRNNAGGSADYFQLASQPDAAAGVGLRIRDASNNTLVRSGEPFLIQGTNAPHGPRDLEFSVNYVKTEKQVIAGDVRAGATFTLSYQ
jgi:type 1 fimbria pilin